MLARHAEKAGRPAAGADRGHRPVLDERTGRVVGVTAKPVDDRGRKVGDEETYRAPLVIAADGNSTRLASRWACERRENRPMGVAVRTYYETPAPRRRLAGVLARAVGRRARTRATCCPATAGSSASATAPPTSGSASSTPRKAFQHVDYKDLLHRWLEHTPDGVGLPRGEPASAGSARAALPMGFNRKPHYTRGVLLVGDAGGMVNPFNGEGIAYAMESGAHGRRDVVQALARPEGPARERVLEGYPPRSTRRTAATTRWAGSSSR